ncbi:PT repeat family protein, partial [Aspergillus aculeatinus CBS 121060]
ETVTISIRRPIDDPIYLAGTFSDPQWEPVELSSKPVDTEPDEDGLISTEYLFWHDLTLPPGQHQYRFREGKKGPCWRSLSLTAAPRPLRSMEPRLQPLRRKKPPPRRPKKL